MSNTTHPEGTINLPTVSACAIWAGEVKGQLSDGQWENSRPFEHYRFWSRLTAAYVADHKPSVFSPVAAPWNQRVKYNIVGLMNLKWDADDRNLDRQGDRRYILRPRMLKTGRMAKALGRVLTYHELCAAEHMPETYALYQEKRLGKSETWQHFDSISEEHATKYYLTKYGKLSLRTDLRHIKAAMLTVEK